MDRNEFNAIQHLLAENRDALMALVTDHRQANGKSGKFRLDPFDYVVQDVSLHNFIDLAGTIGVTGNGSFTVSVPHDFYCTHLMANVVDQTDELTQRPTVLVDVTLGGSDLKLTSQPSHVLNFAGTALRPRYLAEPIAMPAGMTVAVQLTQRVGTANRTYLTFGGYKVRDLDQASATHR